MSRGFQARRGDVTLDLAPVEAAILRDLLASFLDLLGPGREPEPDEDPLFALTGLSAVPAGAQTSSAAGPEADPVLARLFPDASPTDAERSAEFRRLTEGELRDGKRNAAHEVRAAVPARGGRLHLDPEQADLWLTVLNDLRLALGTRLAVRQDDDLDPHHADPDPDPGDEQALARNVYDWLGFLQSTLLRAVGA